MYPQCYSFLKFWCKYTVYIYFSVPLCCVKFSSVGYSNFYFKNSSEYPLLKPIRAHIREYNSCKIGFTFLYIVAYINS